jgi:hypothetical protein
MLPCGVCGALCLLWHALQHANRDLDNIGTTYLANKLSAHLINEITRKLPDIQNYVDKT